MLRRSRSVIQSEVYCPALIRSGKAPCAMRRRLTRQLRTGSPASTRRCAYHRHRPSTRTVSRALVRRPDPCAFVRTGATSSGSPVARPPQSGLVQRQERPKVRLTSSRRHPRDRSRRSVICRLSRKYGTPMVLQPVRSSLNLTTTPDVSHARLLRSSPRIRMYRR